MSETGRTCTHVNFGVLSEVSRLNKTDPETLSPYLIYVLEVKCFCRNCGQMFEFKDVPFGINPEKLGMNVDSLTMRVPITPSFLRAALPKEIN